MKPTDEQQYDTMLPAGVGQWTGYLLAYVTGLAERVYAEAVGRIGLKPLHLAILGILAQEGPLVQARLSEKLHVFKPVMVGLLNELQAMGLVERRRPPGDSRSYEIHLTDTARERLRQMEPINEAVTAQFFHALTTEERAQLHQLLLRLAQSNTAAVVPVEKRPQREETRG